MALRAVIFDYGMVLSQPADPIAHRQLVEIFGAPAEVFERDYWAYRHAYDEGKFDGPGYWRRCAATAGVTLTAKQITDLIAADNRMWGNLNQIMVDWAIEVNRSGLRTGILSNIGFELAAPLQQFDWVRDFTHNTWSCELGIAKPDPAIYHHVIDALDVQPAEALFLDDRIENILSAQSVGIQAVLFRNVQQLQLDLQSSGLAELLPALNFETEASTVA